MQRCLPHRRVTGEGLDSQALTEEGGHSGGRGSVYRDEDGALGALLCAPRSAHPVPSWGEAESRESLWGLAPGPIPYQSVNPLQMGQLAENPE